MADGGAVLTPEDLDRLQASLVERMDDAGCMPLDGAHGFLTATAATGAASETALLDHVLGGLAADGGMRALLARLRAQVLVDLGSDDYGPLILQMPRDDGSTLPLPYGWCQGYMAGIEFLGAAARDALLADEQAGALLTPLLSLLMYDESQWFDPPNEAAHRETVGELGDNAVALYRWWCDRAAG
ncbi:MAG: UPF0149 family protein [Gammaproteobacteria bacterium]|nr:UPF0149 family protein [Gammaproteobacteria bacterium]